MAGRLSSKHIRLRKIEEALERHGEIFIEQFEEQTDIHDASLERIRADLREFMMRADPLKYERFRGGIRLRSHTPEPFSDEAILDKRLSDPVIKQLHLVFTHLLDGGREDTYLPGKSLIFLGPGQSMTELATEIVSRRRGIRIMTNNVAILMRALNQKWYEQEIISIPGSLIVQNAALVGAEWAKDAEKIIAKSSVSIIAVSAISADGSLYCYTPEERPILEAMWRVSSTIILVAVPNSKLTDGTRLESTRFASLFDLRGLTDQTGTIRTTGPLHVCFVTVGLGTPEGEQRELALGDKSEDPRVRCLNGLIKRAEGLRDPEQPESEGPVLILRVPPDGTANK